MMLVGQPEPILARPWAAPKDLTGPSRGGEKKAGAQSARGAFEGLSGSFSYS